MRLGGWILLLGSTALVWSLTIWCYYKVLTAPPEAFTKPPDSLGG
ncbi:MAG TPA: hypothetical protein VGA78_06525 [Gemmatimonadales bacterium]|jgi:hypothetical protein